MKKAPSLYTLEQLRSNSVMQSQCQDKVTGRWVPCRPIGLFSIRSRIRIAWEVFTGRADAFTWPAKQ